ncbi:MAG: imidazolonepropionase [Gammaproteobacteria bacterium]
MQADRIWHHARLATLAPDRMGLGVVDRGLVAARNGRIVYAGPEHEAPTTLYASAAEQIDCEGRWITPGLIDCHTHLVYAGDRAHEFEKRLAGADYAALAREGGGIASTVQATRQASEESLCETALPRLDALLAEGVTTIEIKSGYGLELATELRQLRAARSLAAQRPIDVVTTFLGAHALPAEANGDKDAYIDLVCRQMIPAVAREKVATFVDAYCEEIGFSARQTRQVFEAARTHGLGLKLHADQLTNTHGAALAAEFGATSADHLEYTDEQGVAAMARAGVTAVMLPAAYYFLRDTQPPPIDGFRRHKVPLAVATDCNPGTSPLTSLLLAMNMAATLFRMTVEECLAGVTREAARALGRLTDIGTLEAGKHCDLAIWNIERPAELVYRMGYNPLHARIWRGQ